MQILERHHIEKSPKEILKDAIETNGITSLFCLYSGGQNSGATTDFVKKEFPKLFKGTIFAVTGIGSPMTREFVINYCNKKNWKLNLTWPKENERYVKQVLKHGFAGPGNHGMWMGYLKYHGWRSFILDYRKKNPNEKPALISGVYKKESNARNKIKKYSQTPIDIDGNLIFIKPFLKKTRAYFHEYFLKEGLKKSPTYEWFRRSGECYCGSKVDNWELALIRQYDKFSYDNIKWLEKLLQEKGNKKAKKYPKWGSGPTDLENQKTMIDYNEYCEESCE